MTAALPIEYGTVQACSYLAGVVFFQEHKTMKGWQLAVGFTGLAVILSGVAISAMTSLPCSKKLSKVQPPR